MNFSWTKNSHQILEQASQLKNYTRWTISLFSKYFGKNILEIGSGLGGVSQYLPKKHVTLSDVCSDYIKKLKSQFGYKTIKINIEKDSFDKQKNNFDTIISSNVFEHIKDDERALRNCFNLLNKNGKLLLFVPARPEIYGSLDKAMGHFRRYTKEELTQKTKEAGFKIIEIKYVNFPGYFSWWLRGKMSSRSNSDSVMAKIFDTLVVPLLYLEKNIPIPFGQSLMLVAEKP